MLLEYLLLPPQLVIYCMPPTLFTTTITTYYIPYIIYLNVFFSINRIVSKVHYIGTLFLLIFTSLMFIIKEVTMERIGMDTKNIFVLSIIDVGGFNFDKNVPICYCQSNYIVYIFIFSFLHI